jgi:serine/threonine-protein kinase
VIHRDIKPENILLHDGRPMVADFGIALAVSAAAGGRMTETGLSLGTPHYMSPEQATAEKEISARSDVYSLASVLFEMLAGEPPHSGGSAQAIIMKIIAEPAQLVTKFRKSVPPNVAAAVAKALEKVPADRFETARAFGDALGSPAFALGAVGPRSTDPVRGVPRPNWMIVALGATCVALVVLAVRGWTRETPPAQAVEFELALPDSFDIISTGAASSLSLSRDGQSIVFIARTPGTGYQVYERRLDDRTIRVIGGTTTARSPVLSPDATELLFSPSADNSARATLSRISTRGGTPRSVAQSAANNGQYSWGDKNKIVFSDRDTLWMVNADGGLRVLLAAPDSARRHLNYGFPDILPDGNAALISIWRGAGSLDSIAMGVVTIPDGKVTELGTYGIYARYSATGHIVYGSTSGTLLAVPFDARARRITGSPTVIAEDVRGGAGGAIPMTVSRNGTLAFIPSSRVAVGAVIPIIVDRTGRERPLSVKRGWYRSPRVSPDGKQVALVIGTGPSGGNVAEPDIWRLDVGSADLQRVTTDRSSDRPLWSRDGLQIHFSKFPLDSVLWTIPLYAGAKPASVLSTPGNVLATDVGSRHPYVAMTVQQPNGRFGIWLAHADSLSQVRPFIAESYAAASPRISPDGRLIAYTSNRTGQSEVYVRALPSGGEEVKASANGGVDPVWAPGGRELFFRTFDNPASESLLVAQISMTPRLAIAGRQALFALGRYHLQRNRGGYDVFPNGEFVFLSQRSDTAPERTPLVVRLNWTGALRTPPAKREP